MYSYFLHNQFRIIQAEKNEVLISYHWILALTSCLCVCYITLNLEAPDNFHAASGTSNVFTDEGVRGGGGLRQL